MIIKKGIPAQRIKEVLDYSYSFFSDVMGKLGFKHYMLEIANIDWDSSVMLLDDNDKLLGSYILGNNQMNSLIFDNRFNKLLGIEGVLLCVDESIRGQGWGNKLKEYPKSLPIDYIWGQQFKSLNNLEDWLKRRELIGETSDVYITAELFH